MASVNCIRVRTSLITTIDIDTGAPTHRKWVTGPCGAPLFTDKDRETGHCRSCRRGWVHPDNYPADGARPAAEGYRA
jgi:hypothetical protein